MKDHRIAQINELIAQELGKIIIREVEFPNHAVVTITKVVTETDLSRAAIYIAVRPDEEKDACVKLLRKNGGHLQRLLIRAVSMNHVPRIAFRHYAGSEAEKQEREEHEMEHVLDLIKEDK